MKKVKQKYRREAKLMWAIKAAKKDLKKAQKKQSKAQARLEERSTTLHTLPESSVVMIDVAKMDALP